jgi:hypothetical protein
MRIDAVVKRGLWKLLRELRALGSIAEELLTAKTAMKFREEREEGLSLRLCALCGEISSCI